MVVAVAVAAFCLLCFVCKFRVMLLFVPPPFLEGWDSCDFELSVGHCVVPGVGVERCFVKPGTQ